MIEFFLAICAFTTLECEDITVTYYDGLEEDTYGAAAYDTSGNYYILINPEETRGKKEIFWKQLMVHEIAHLIAFEIDPTYTSHYGLYEEICQDLKERAGVMGRNVCKPYAHPPPYPWVARR